MKMVFKPNTSVLYNVLMFFRSPDHIVFTVCF